MNAWRKARDRNNSLTVIADSCASARLSEKLWPQILPDMQDGTNEDGVAVFRIKYIVRLEAKAARACQQLVHGNAHLGKIGEQPESALKSGVIRARLIDAPTTLGKSANVSDLLARLR
jgi:hypothetical protein